MQLKKVILSLFVLTHLITKSQVVINEVMPKPTNAGDNCDQSFVNATTPSCGREYIEIYNTNSCNSVDISCYIIASKTSASSGGAFAFPNGTVIPPLGHLVVGAPNSSATTGSVDFLLSNYIGQSNLCQTNRWYLENGNGWIALYDPSGNVVDAIYWTFFAGQQTILTTDVDFSYTPCSPTSCFNGILKSASQMSLGTEINYVGEVTNTGFTFSRIPDGGAWQRNINPSIAGANNCNNGTCVTASNFTLSSTINNPNCGLSNGSATISVNPAAGVYTYTWSSPAVSSTNSANNLSAGTYTINVSLNGCTSSTVITLQANGSPTITNILTSPSQCGGTTGSATVIVNPANSTYAWSTPVTSTTNTASNLSPGNYTVTVSNSGCNTTTIVTINSSNGPNAVTINTTAAACGLNNGTIAFSNVIGGTAPYQYNFNNLGFSSNSSYTAGPGTYPVIISDAGNCTFSTSVSISSNSGPTSVNTNTIAAQCGLSNGQIIITSVTGGTSPYQYNFNNTNFSSLNSYTIGSGTYPLIIRDQGNCTYSTTIIIPQNPGPSDISYNTTPSVCGQNNGVVTITGATGGTSPYSYNFNNEGFSTTTSFTVEANNYPLVVQDVGGCTYSISISVLNTNPVFTPITQIQTPSCETNDGSISILSVSGGSFPYEYNFNNGGYGNGSSFSELSAGIYTISIRDNIDCIYEYTVNINKSEEEPILFIPNSFSPNNDKLNDNWFPRGYCISEYVCYIFNRWGEKIVQLNRLDEKWDGTHKGKEATDDVYIYKIEARGFNKNYLYKTGHIYIIR